MTVLLQRFDTAVQLARELRAFNKEQELATDVIPKANILRAADRHDLLSEIQRYGGALSLAPQIGMTTQRGSGYATGAAAVKELLKYVQRSYMVSSEPRQLWCMPTQQQLREAGRHDLLAAIRKYGHSKLAHAADLKQNIRGRPSVHHDLQGEHVSSDS